MRPMLRGNSTVSWRWGGETQCTCGEIEDYQDNNNNSSYIGHGSLEGSRSAVGCSVTELCSITNKHYHVLINSYVSLASFFPQSDNFEQLAGLIRDLLISCTDLLLSRDDPDTLDHFNFATDYLCTVQT